MSTCSHNGVTHVLQKWQCEGNGQWFLHVITYSYSQVTTSYLHGVTCSYLQLPGVTCGYIQLPGVTCGYIQLPGVTCGYIQLPGVTCGYIQLPGVTFSDFPVCTNLIYMYKTWLNDSYVPCYSYLVAFVTSNYRN